MLDHHGYGLELVQTTWANIVEISLRVVSLSALLWCLGLLPRQWHQDFILLSMTKTLWLFIAMIFDTFNLKTLTNNIQTWYFDNFENFRDSCNSKTLIPHQRQRWSSSHTRRWQRHVPPGRASRRGERWPWSSSRGPAHYVTFVSD